MARALNKPMLMVSVDDSLPPSYAQDVRINLSRYCATRPWLTPEEALMECILRSPAAADKYVYRSHTDDTTVVWILLR